MEIKLEIAAISIASWITKGIEWYLIGRAIGLIMGDDLIYSIGFMMILNASITLLQFAPIPSVAGAGVSEAGVVGILYFFGIEPSSAISFGILTRMIMIIQDGFGVGFIIEYFRKHSLAKIWSKIKDIKRNVINY